MLWGHPPPILRSRPFAIAATAVKEEYFSPPDQLKRDLSFLKLLNCAKEESPPASGTEKEGTRGRNFKFEGELSPYSAEAQPLHFLLPSATLKRLFPLSCAEKAFPSSS